MAAFRPIGMAQQYAIYDPPPRSHTLHESDALAARLAKGEIVVLFAEGTSSDGLRVLPFKSSFLSVPEGNGDYACKP